MISLKRDAVSGRGLLEADDDWGATAADEALTRWPCCGRVRVCDGTVLQMKEVYANMTDMKASFDELYAVYSKVVARSHTIPVKVEMQPGVFDWKYMPALVPLVDMMNQGVPNIGTRYVCVCDGAAVDCLTRSSHSRINTSLRPACYTPEKGDEFVCETLEELEEGTELLA